MLPVGVAADSPERCQLTLRFLIVDVVLRVVIILAVVRLLRRSGERGQRIRQAEAKGYEENSHGMLSVDELTFYNF